ncbi:hypothetical protein [Shinella sp.]|uniref:hypothetical protein n=1 Tax=Shinella sp. TaxID=1870904 RepID=UPI00258C6B61|nr:hypothetical protein [Shinella sp.]MCW5706115.1 hypothetical protein [Shinella sp.]
MSQTPRLRAFLFHVGQDVLLRGFPATIHQRLRTATGRAMYAVLLAGEPACRHVMEDGLQAADQTLEAA